VGKDPVGVDAFLVEQLNGLFTENVIAHFPDKIHFSSKTGYGNCLIGALSARVHKERPAKNGFAWLWDVTGLDDHVHVHAADDNDSVAHIRLENENNKFGSFKSKLRAVCRKNEPIFLNFMNYKRSMFLIFVVYVFDNKYFIYT